MNEELVVAFREYINEFKKLEIRDKLKGEQHQQSS